MGVRISQPGMRILEPSGDTLAGRPQSHSPALYRRVLGQGLPAFRLDDAELLAAVIEWCVTEPQDQRSVAEILDDLAAACDEPLEVVKLPLLALVAGNAFVRLPNELPLAQQRLTLRQDLRTPEGLLGQLRLTWLKRNSSGTLGRSISGYSRRSPAGCQGRRPRLRSARPSSTWFLPRARGA